MKRRLRSRLAGLLDRMGLRVKRRTLPIGLARARPISDPERLKISGQPASINGSPVRVGDVVSCIGVSFEAGRSHPFVLTLKQWLRDPDIAYPETALAEYFRLFQPQTLGDVLIGDGSVCPTTASSWPAMRSLYELPWVLDPEIVKRRLRDFKGLASDGQHFGPALGRNGERHFERLIGVYRSLEIRGYRPFDFADVSGGYFLEYSGDFRFVLTRNGNHRLAALTVLEHPFVLVRPRTVLDGPILRYGDLHRTPVVRGGLMELEEAQYVFMRLFHGSGPASSVLESSG